MRHLSIYIPTEEILAANSFFCPDLKAMDLFRCLVKQIQEESKELGMTFGNLWLAGYDYRGAFTNL